MQRKKCYRWDPYVCITCLLHIIHTHTHSRVMRLDLSCSFRIVFSPRSFSCAWFSNLVAEVCGRFIETGYNSRWKSIFLREATNKLFNMTMHTLDILCGVYGVRCSRLMSHFCGDNRWLQLLLRECFGEIRGKLQCRAKTSDVAPAEGPKSIMDWLCYMFVILLSISMLTLFIISVGFAYMLD